MPLPGDLSGCRSQWPVGPTALGPFSSGWGWLLQQGPCPGSWESTPPGWPRPSAHGPLADSLSLCPVAAGSGSGTSGRGSCYLSDEICSERKKRVVERTPPTGYQRLRQEPGDFRPEPLPAHSWAPRTPSLTPLVFLWFRPLPLRLGPFVREFHLPQ